MNPACKCLLATVVLATFGARADFFSGTNSWSSGEMVVPDGQPEGVASTLKLEIPENALLEEIRISLTIDSQYNGDLYVTLSHGEDFSVLLNRVGRDDSTPFGYGDSGLSDISFTDTATDDIHIYRTFVVGDPAVSLSGPLTGTWQADGRTTDPDSVVTSDSRTATLDTFTGKSAGGTWTLFVADLSPGGSSELRSWSIEIAATVPEPSTALLGMVGAGALVVLGRRRNNRA